MPILIHPTRTFCCRESKTGREEQYNCMVAVLLHALGRLQPCWQTYTANEAKMPCVCVVWPFTPRSFP